MKKVIISLAAIAAMGIFTATASAVDTNWGGWSGANHCDNLADPNYATTHQTGSRPGDTQYVVWVGHADDGTCPAASDTAVSSPVVGTGYLNPPAGPAQPGACGASNPRNPDCTSLGGVYVGTADHSVGVGVRDNGTLP
jgi:hypothetical protein